MTVTMDPSFALPRSVCCCRSASTATAPPRLFGMRGPSQTAPTAFLPFDSSVVVEDEIDFCLRWPDVPRAPSAVPASPYPSVPTLILQGGEDLRTPPEVSARVAAQIPGSVRLVVPGTGHSTVSDPRTCSADAIERFVAGRTLPKSPCKRIPTGIPAVLGTNVATRSIPDGAWVRVDGDAGTVTVLDA